MKRLTLALLIILLLGFAACKRETVPPSVYDKYDHYLDKSKPMAFGDDRDIQLFVSDELQADIMDILAPSLTRKVQLSVLEQYFYLQPVSGDKIKEFANYKNLIFCGTLDGGDKVSRHIRSTLKQDILDRVKASGAEMVMASNVTVRDQLLLYLVASDAQALQQLASSRKDQIFEKFLERYSLRQGYQAYVNAVIDNKLFRSLPYTIQIPQLFDIYSNNPEGNFMSFVYKPRTTQRDLPDKFVSIYYEAMPQNKVNREWLLEKRKELLADHFPGDQILEDKIEFDYFQIGGFDALRLRGAWINSGISGGVGGAFQTYAFWHAPSRTAFVVDNIVYFPAGDKLPVLLELEQISASLRVK